VFRDEIINRALSTDVIQQEDREVMPSPARFIGEELCDRLDKEKFYVKRFPSPAPSSSATLRGRVLKVKRTRRSKPAGTGDADAPSTDIPGQ